VQPNTLLTATGRIVGYEGYTSGKGFSILSEHPVTGAKLNEEKYVKQPGDTPQVAAQKLSLYLNDKVLPPVARALSKYRNLPGYLQTEAFNVLMETTYHAGNPQAMMEFMDAALDGTLDVRKFKDSPLFKDAGAGSRRNVDRMTFLSALNNYRINNRS